MLPQADHSSPESSMPDITRVLVVARDYGVCFDIETRLSQGHRRFQVDCVADVWTAMALLSGDSFDVCLIHHDVEGINGFELLRELNLSSNHIPVILLTDPGDSTSGPAALSVGAADYLTIRQSEDSLLGHSILHTIERVRSVKLKADNDEGLRLILEYLPVIQFTLDKELVCTYVAGNGLEILGMKSEEITGHSIVNDGCAIGQIADMASRALAGETLVEVVSMKGHTLETHIAPARTISGDIIGVDGMAIDITQLHRGNPGQCQRHTVEKLSESEEKFRRIVETAQEGIWIVSKTSELVLANPRIGRMLGYTPEEMLGVDVFKFIHPDDHRVILQHFERRKVGESSTYDVRLRHRNGTAVWTMVAGSPFLDSIGNYSGSLAMITDISERKQTEARLQELNNQLELRVRERTTEVVSAMTQLEQSYATQRRFIADASHDIRTPLTVIRAEVDLLLRRDGYDQITVEALQRVVTESKRLERITDDLILLATLDAVTPDVEKGYDTVRPGELLIEALTRLGPVVRRKNIVWNTLVDFELELRCIPIMVERAMFNILENAVNFSPEGATIDIHLSATDTSVMLTVSDFGPGIEAHDLSRIFDRFYRSDRTRNTPGTGLGLSIVKAVVEAHGGTVDIVSSPGKGTTLTLGFPTTAI
jgi:PAS domain S-box-containing protein